MPKMRMTQRYVTGSPGMVSLAPAPRFEIFGVRRMQFQVESQPQHFRISDEPDPKEKGHRHHNAQCNRGVSNPEHVIKDGPGTKSGGHCKRVADGNVRKKISAFAHEEVSTTWTTFRAIEIASK